MTAAELERMEARRAEIDRRLRALGIEVKVPSVASRRLRSAAAVGAPASTRPAVEPEDRWVREAAREAHRHGRLVRCFWTRLEVH